MSTTPSIHHHLLDAISETASVHESRQKASKQHPLRVVVVVVVVVYVCIYIYIYICICGGVYIYIYIYMYGGSGAC